MADPIETSRLRLRPLVPEDLGAMHAIHSRADVVRWLYWEPRTEAEVRETLTAFESYGLHRVSGRLEARNVASARVLERLGMRREAHLVENEWVKGEWQSELVYALLEREWRALSGPGSA
ncbi:MAG TPA: GNAT family N-acetyltransferase [Solirubrobacteraceae bacterium]|nr:GNAT family N-acetyltransferase [Solirubrobacteraceae bacterium]